MTSLQFVYTRERHVLNSKSEKTGLDFHSKGCQELIAINFVEVITRFLMK